MNEYTTVMILWHLNSNLQIIISQISRKIFDARKDVVTFRPSLRSVSEPVTGKTQHKQLIIEVKGIYAGLALNNINNKL